MIKNFTIKLPGTILLLITGMIAFFYTGCLKDSNQPVAPGFNNSAELLVYVELNRNFINSAENPALVSVDELYSNKDKYLIIDIREKTQFVNGHIEGSKNIQPKDLLTFLKSINSSEFPKIVIVSKSGQDAAFITCLLRLWGLNNVYSLNFGIAQWNKSLSDDWIKARSHYSVRNNNDFTYSKNSFYSLPGINYSDDTFPIENKLEERITLLLGEGYDPVKTTLKETFTNYFDYGLNKFTGCYVMCYGPEFLYVGGAINMYGPAGHPAGSVFYNPISDLKSTSYLQTIPSDKPVVIYSLNGQQGAFLAAYLRLLGYDAKNIAFGSWSMWGYSYIFSQPGRKGGVDYFKTAFTNYGFWVADPQNLGLAVAKNYPLVTGE
ncbi:MAG: rhodanese-like domain-containing protein [Ignavibacteriales bacterium]|nr:rhodanese-like domain-containing protein [Ignavibacteriales bacterium]